MSGYGSDQQIRADAIRERKRTATARSRARNGHHAEHVRGRAIILASTWVRTNHPDIWLECMKEAREHVNAKRGE